MRALEYCHVVVRNNSARCRGRRRPRNSTTAFPNNGVRRVLTGRETDDQARFRLSGGYANKRNCRFGRDSSAVANETANADGLYEVDGIVTANSAERMDSRGRCFPSLIRVKTCNVKQTTKCVRYFQKNSTNLLRFPNRTFSVDRACTYTQRAHGSFRFAYGGVQMFLIRCPRE